jgi:hypothetical protein
MTDKFFVMSEVNLAHEQAILPAWSPFEGAASFNDAYCSFAYDTEAQANEEARHEEAELKSSVESGDLSDADPIVVKKGTLSDDGTITLEDGTVLTAERLYGHFGIDLPAFGGSGPSL